jgi:radical SAM superfamily enzyme YgiQ (UPF0313 family)
VLAEAIRQLIRDRLAAEVGRVDKSAAWRVGLAYPAPYRVAMSSLGYQRIYRALQALPGVACERLFLADGGDRPGATFGQPVSYEGLRPLREFPLAAFSIAYELELAAVVRMLQAARIPLLSEQRDERWPLLLAGGPLTFSNPLPLAPFFDAVVMGEAEGIIEWVTTVIRESSTRADALAELARHPHVFVPTHHGSRLAELAACGADQLPAYSAILTRHAELRNMFLIECERGCSRDCTYCIMRRSGRHTMRLVPLSEVTRHIPAQARRVGLVGAAVSDHPDIVRLVSELGARGCSVGLSSLRPDRLDERFVAALKASGYRSLTTALDGASERLRRQIRRRCREQHFISLAQHARKHAMARLKLYLMLGLPGETDDDVDECVRFVTELSRILPVSLGVAPFCAKPGTPLGTSAYAGVRAIDRRLQRLKRGLQGRAGLRATSTRWGWVEHVLAQGTDQEGLAVAEAVGAGGRFADFRAALGRLGHAPAPDAGLGTVARSRQRSRQRRS